ncbi:MAG: hypothetical protein H6739_35360 [Alphaproteobacteria bacterium]|nr:hypothetical protein [Alphaproteobacteria bacterium]
MVDHATIARFPRLFPGQGRAPAILKRTDQQFLPAVLDALRSPAGRAALNQDRPTPTDDNGLLLYQPVHRTFHLALTELVCEMPGFPRLDPRKIESAGLVVRRVSREHPDRQERWVVRDEKIEGWVEIEDDLQRDEDPDPRRRRAPGAGHPEVDRHLATPSPLAERVTPLFLPPPDVMEACGRTLLYGLIPLASSEVAQREPARIADADLAHVIPTYLTTKAPRTVPWAGQTVRLRGAPSAGETRIDLEQKVGREDMRSWGMLTATQLDQASAVTEDVDDYIQLLRALLIQFDALEDADSELAKALNTITLSFPSGQARTTFEHLRQAAAALISGDDAAVEMPRAWPKITTRQARRLQRCLQGAAQQRYDQIASGIPRYGRRSARYVVRCFARVRRDDGCPPRLVWTDESAVFTIAEWYEPGPAEVQPTSIKLPGISRDFFKSLRPNVAFEIPQDLFDFVGANTPKQVFKGNIQEGAKGSFPGWICGFNIPIITICAFFLLYIILYLLHWIFWWLPWVKICFPIPTNRES